MPRSIPSTPPRDSSRFRLIVSVDSHAPTGTDFSPSKQSRRSRLMMQISKLTRDKTVLLNACVLLATIICFTFLCVSSIFSRQQAMTPPTSSFHGHIQDESQIEKVSTSHATVIEPHTQQIRSSQLAVAACHHPTKKFNIMPQAEVKKDVSYLLHSIKDNTFAKLLNNLILSANQQNKKLVSFQIGGMDGKSNDPMHKAADRMKDLSGWMPVVIEPVHKNFVKLESTYREHKRRKDLQCSYLLEQVVSYDHLKENDNGRHVCPLCVFDWEREECKDSPDWLKTQIATTALSQFRLRNPCFKMENYPCSTIAVALTEVGLSSSDISVLQLDVEGAEKEILEGFLRETPKQIHPPIIHFEIKVLKSHLGVDEEVLTFLRSYGYEIIYDPGDADALAVLKVDNY